MQTLKAEMNWARPFDASKSGADRQTVDHDQLGAGWWLLPSMIGGAAFWVWAFANLLN